MDFRSILKSLGQLSEATKETGKGRIHTAEPGGYGRKDDEDDEGNKVKPASTEKKVVDALRKLHNLQVKIKHMILRVSVMYLVAVKSLRKKLVKFLRSTVLKIGSNISIKLH